MASTENALVSQTSVNVGHDERQTEIGGDTHTRGELQGKRTTQGGDNKNIQCRERREDNLREELGCLEDRKEEHKHGEDNNKQKPLEPLEGSEGGRPRSHENTVPCGSSADREMHWYVAQIVRPQLDQLLDALRTTSNLLLYNTPNHPGSGTSRGPAVTLPLSSSNKTISGVLTRDGAYVTKIQAKVAGSKVVSRLSLVRPVLVAQIISAKSAIDRATVLLVQASSLFEASDHVDHAALIEVLRQLHIELAAAKEALQLPTDPSLVFPQHVTALDSFEPDFGHRLAVDVYISQAEVCVDVKDLRRVTERPWCEVDASGKSYADQVRDEMVAGRKPPVQLEDSVWQRLLRHKVDVADYVARCVTYDGVVVMVQQKAEVLLPDPVLYSAFTKLDTVEYVVGAFMENMEKLM